VECTQIISFQIPFMMEERKTKGSAESLFCLLDPVHHIMVIQENTHWLPIDAEKEPKDHVANLLKIPQVRTSSHRRTIPSVATRANKAHHCVSEFIFEV
jgi:hypothetical protein